MYAIPLFVVQYGNLTAAEDYFSQVLTLLTPTDENKALTQANKLITACTCMLAFQLFQPFFQGV